MPYSDFGARLHDPRTGRWLAPDPLAEKYYGYSLYSFCKNTPVSRIDLDGQDDYRFDNKSGQFIMMEQNNNSKDRVLGYHLDKKTGEYTKNHRWYQRKTLIDNIEKGIFSYTSKQP
ncbi:MAG: hypothetical protein MJY84_05855 [Bacteroidales bacterium]|nr:hypothetical protein [Bacteroidales bacterium]